MHPHDYNQLADARGQLQRKRLLAFKQLRDEKGIPYSRDHLRRLCKAGRFPAPIPLSSSGRICWLESEVDAWIAARAELRGGNAA